MNWTKAKRKEKYILIPVYALAYLISYISGIGCIWKKIFGIPCPGCGLTRSVLYMLKLDFKDAWHCHPMFWSVFILGLYFVFEGDVFRNRKINAAVILLVLAGFLFVWLYRLFNGIMI